MPKKIIDQETAAAAIAALVDVLDGEDEHDIRANTGLSETLQRNPRPLLPASERIHALRVSRTGFSPQVW